MAQIDTSIYNNIQPARIESPLNALMNVSQVQAAQRQNKLAELALGQKEREIADDQAVRNVYSRYGTGEQALAELAKVSPTAYRTEAKSQAELAKQQREAEKARLAAAKDRVELIGQVAGSANDPQSYAAGIEILKNAGVDVSGIPAQYDPNYVAQARQQALSAAQQLEQVWKQKNYDFDVEKFGYQKTNDVQNRAVTVRGQDLQNARSKEQNNIMSQGNIIKAETDIRKEFNDLPEVKNYKAAYPSFKAVMEASSRTGPQADINLIYGLAKLYDPTSVVREGEYATIANSQAIPERIKSLAQQLAGGGKLTPKTKEQLRTEATSRIGTYESEYQKARGSYEGVVKQRGGDSSNVFPDAGSFKTVKVGGKALTARQAPDGKFYVEQNGKYFEVR